MSFAYTHNREPNSVASSIGRLAIAVLVLMLALPTMSVASQTWPNRPIRIIISQSPGGASDMLIRVIAQPLSEVLGQPVVVDNKPGATGLIGTEIAATAAADGYTLFVFQDVNTILPSIMKKLRYDPATSFTPITMIGSSPAVLVAHPSLPQNTVPELFQYAKENPNKLSYGTPGIGTTQHLGAEILQRTVGIKMTMIPYKGGGQAITDVLAGHIPLAMLGVPPILAHVAAGNLKALAVTGHKRSRFFPDVPTFLELGYSGVEDIGQWNGIVAPAGTPPAIIARLHDEIVKIMQRPAILEKMVTIGMEATTSPTPDDFKRLIKNELKRWPEVVKAAGIQAE